MYDWELKKKNHFTIGTVLLQAPSQETSPLVQFSVQQFGYFSILMKIYFLKTKSRNQPGWGAGKAPKQSSERRCAKDRNFRNKSTFLLSNKFSGWHQKKKSSAISLSFDNISCSSVPCPFICFLQFLQESISQVSQPRSLILELSDLLVL